MEFFYILSAYVDPWILALFFVWILPWKGVALWRAATNQHKMWFVVLLVLHTLAIVEIVYIFFFSKRTKTGDKGRGAGGLKRKKK